MIFDKIGNYKIYTGLGNKIAKGLAYLVNTDLHSIESGKHIIDEDDDIFALIQDYETKDIADCKLEGHLKYIDIQYVISGFEHMGITSLTNQIPIDKDVEKDYTFYEGETSIIKVSSGMFTIFFPNDLHQPCIAVNEKTKVKKIVIKVRIW